MGNPTFAGSSVAGGDPVRPRPGVCGPRQLWKDIADRESAQLAECGKHFRAVIGDGNFIPAANNFAVGSDQICRPHDPHIRMTVLRLLLPDSVCVADGWRAIGAWFIHKQNEWKIKLLRE